MLDSTGTWLWHLQTDVIGKYCTYSNSEPQLLIRLLRHGGMVDIHSFQLDVGEKEFKHVGRLLGSPGICFVGTYSTFPPVLFFPSSFPWETRTTLGWVDLHDSFQVWLVLSHSWLNSLLCIRGWVETGQMREKRKSGPHFSDLRGRSVKWDFNGRDHIHENPFLLPGKRKTGGTLD